METELLANPGVLPHYDGYDGQKQQEEVLAEVGCDDQRDPGLLVELVIGREYQDEGDDYDDLQDGHDLGDGGIESLG